MRILTSEELKAVSGAATNNGNAGNGGNGGTGGNGGNANGGRGGSIFVVDNINIASPSLTIGSSFPALLARLLRVRIACV
jgi:hypothetical protein